MRMKKCVAVLLAGTLFVSLAAACGKSADQTDSEIVVGENQRLAYAVVTQIQGNEMTYMEVDESQVIQSGKSDDGNDQEDRGTPPDMDSTEQGDRGTPPDMDSTKQESRGTPPDMDSTEQEDRGTLPDMDSTEQEDRGTPPDMDSSGQEGKGSFSGKTVTVQIPVGVTVHTTSDTTTTFSRIKSGDVLKLLLETDENGEEVIVEIWMSA